MCLRTFSSGFGHWSPSLTYSDQPRPRMLRLTPKAKRVWTAYLDRHAEEQVELDGDLAAAWSKLRGWGGPPGGPLPPRRCPGGGEEEPERIDQASVEAGIGLTDWFGNEARLVYGLLCESDEEREERELTSWIDGKGGRATVRARCGDCDDTATTHPPSNGGWPASSSGSAVGGCPKTAVAAPVVRRAFFVLLPRW